LASRSFTRHGCGATSHPTRSPGDTVFENVPIEKIKDAVKLATGLADTFVDAETGKTYYVLRSMSFASLDQAAFNSFFDEACMVIANRWMPAGTTPEDVRKELLAMVDGPGALGSKVAPNARRTA